MNSLRLIITVLALSFILSLGNISASYSQEAGKIIFSNEPITSQIPAYPQSSFSQSDYIYSVVTFCSDYQSIIEKRPYKLPGSVILDVQYFDNDSYAGAFYIKLKGSAVSKNYLIMDIAPKMLDMTAYSDPNVVYSEVDGVKNGAIGYASFLSQLTPGIHTIGIKVSVAGKEVSSGKFTIQGDDFSLFYFDLYTKLLNYYRTGNVKPKFKKY